MCPRARGIGLWIPSLCASWSLRRGPPCRKEASFWGAGPVLSLCPRLQQLDEENSELKACVPCLRASIERLEEVSRWPGGLPLLRPRHLMAVGGSTGGGGFPKRTAARLAWGPTWEQLVDQYAYSQEAVLLQRAGLCVGGKGSLAGLPFAGRCRILPGVMLRSPSFPECTGDVSEGLILARPLMPPPADAP